MREMTDDYMLIEMYVIFYKEFTGFQDFVFCEKKGKQGVQVRNFLDYFRKKMRRGVLGYNFLLAYVKLTFLYWYQKDFSTTTFQMSLSWITGKKAIQRFEAISFKDMPQQIFFADEMIYETGLSKKLTDLRRIKKINLSLTVDQKAEKLRFYNTIRGLFHCLRATYGYAEQSPCLSCNFKTICKKKENRWN